MKSFLKYETLRSLSINIFLGYKLKNSENLIYNIKFLSKYLMMNIFADSFIVIIIKTILHYYKLNHIEFNKGNVNRHQRSW